MTSTAGGGAGTRGDPLRVALVQFSPDAGKVAANVERALSALSYPDVDATLRLAVADDHAPWNVGTFELRVADGSGECRRVDGSGAGGGSGAADAALGVGPLSQLVVGSRSALELARTGDLEAGEATVETLTELFPQESVYLREYF